MLRNIVSQFGEDKVQQVGLQVLGFPPAWVTEASEANRIYEVLNNASL